MSALAPEAHKPAPARGRGGVSLIALLATLLTLSAFLNVVLYRLAFKFFRDGMAVRLDPTDSARAVAPPPLAPGQVRVVYVGDSRIDNWSAPPAPETCQVVNRGIGGQTTEQVFLRLDRDVLALEPRVVVLQAGVNDLRTLGLFPGHEEAIVARCASNLRAIVERLRARGVVVVVTTIFPVGRVELARRPVWSDATIDAIDRVNRGLLGLAGPGVIVVDCDKVLRNGRRIEPTFAVDSLHLSESGYEALAATLRPILQAVVADLPIRRRVEPTPGP